MTIYVEILVGPVNAVNYPHNKLTDMSVQA